MIKKLMEKKNPSKGLREEVEEVLIAHNIINKSEMKFKRKTVEKKK